VLLSGLSPTQCRLQTSAKLPCNPNHITFSPRATLAIKDASRGKTAHRRVKRGKTFLLEIARRLLHRIGPMGYLRDHCGLRS
jgi:hypothetical protein